jgi:hypothetical protein
MSSAHITLRASSGRKPMGTLNYPLNTFTSYPATKHDYHGCNGRQRSIREIGARCNVCWPLSNDGEPSPTSTSLVHHARGCRTIPCSRRIRTAMFHAAIKQWTADPANIPHTYSIHRHSTSPTRFVPKLSSYSLPGLVVCSLSWHLPQNGAEGSMSAMRKPSAAQQQMDNNAW